MGKGGGKGRGKGGCEVCIDGVVSMVICGLIILFLGPILIAVGIAMLVSASKNDRQSNIDSVNNAVKAWQGSGPNNQNFANGQSFYLRVAPALNSAQCTGDPTYTFTQAFTVSNQKTEYFSDDPNNWSSVQQTALVSQLAAGAQAGCGWSLQVVYVGSGGGNVSLGATYTLTSPVVQNVQLNPSIGTFYCPSPGTSLGSCSSSTARGCQSNCQALGGTWSCTGSGSYTCLGPASISQLCVKMTRASTTAPWEVDATSPNQGQGCSVLPQSILRSTTQGNAVFGNQFFSVPNATVSSVTNSFINVVLRNSAEPWLTYMQVTDGTGELGTSKSTLTTSGIILIVVGSIITLTWGVAIYCCVKICCCGGMGSSRPQGAVDGRAWDVANRFGYVATGVPVAGAVPMQAYPPPHPNYAYPPQPGYPAQQQPGAPYAYPPQGAYYPPPPPQGGAPNPYYPPPPPQGGAYPPVQGNWQQPPPQQPQPSAASQYPPVGKA